MSPNQLSRIAALFNNAPNAPGCVAGVLRHGEPSWAEGFGLASVEHGVPIAPDTRFRIASVSKQFTCAAVLMLEAEGKLQRDDDVRQHLPELPALAHTLTLDHLMRNCSGLPDFLELLRLGGVGLEQRLDRAAMLNAIKRCKHLNFVPGSRFLYCNSNFLLLGLIVEKLSGQTLDEFLRERIFTPVGMGDTELLASYDGVADRLAAPYLPDNKGGHIRALHGFEHGGEGGLVSSVGDLLRWADELLSPRSGLAPIIEALQQRIPLNNGTASPYARGLEHSKWLGRSCVGHGGLWPGYRTEFVVMPAERMAAVVISNDGGRNPYKLARELLRIALNEPDSKKVEPDLRGEWFDPGTGQLLELLEQGGEQMVKQWGTPFELKQEADGTWMPQRGAYEFQLDAQGGEQMRLDIGAGTSASLKRLSKRSALPSDLHGAFHCEDIASTWRIDADGSVCVEGPILKAQGPWRLQGLGDDWVELHCPGYWMQSSVLLRIERNAASHISALCVDSGRIKSLRFTPR